MKPSRPSHHVFRGKRYCIRWRPPNDPKNIGECENPVYKKPVMIIHPALTGLERLITILDEGMHACQYDLDNDVVGVISYDLGTLLWECGLRFRDEMSDKP